MWSDYYQLFLFLFIVFMWFYIYSIIWVAKDISRRTNALHFQIWCIISIVFLTPLLWLPLYFFIRPVQRYDTRWKIIAQKEHKIICAGCGKKNETGYEFCPYCWDEVTQQCQWCMTILPHDYYYCPFCGNHLKEI